MAGRKASSTRQSGAQPARSSKQAAAAAAATQSRSGFLPSVGILPLATWLISLYGLGASIYLTIAHYDTHVQLVCSDKGVINCAEVTTSSQSMVFGVLPVAVLGLAFYVFMVAINSPWAWRLQRPVAGEQLSAWSGNLTTAIMWARLISVVVGMGFVLYLIYAEVIQIGAICLWCTSVHVATFLIFALIVFDSSFNWGKPQPTGLG